MSRFWQYRPYITLNNHITESLTRSCESQPLLGATVAATSVVRRLPRRQPSWSCPRWPERSSRDATPPPSQQICRGRTQPHEMHAVSSVPGNQRSLADLSTNCVNVLTTAVTSRWDARRTQNFGLLTAFA